MEHTSIVVPSYNHSQYIEACLDSIYFQDAKNLEIIVVDDCSTDDSIKKIHGWIRGIEDETVSFASFYDEDMDIIQRTECKRYNKKRTIVFLMNQENMGSTWTYNRGFKAATGMYCSFVAADDICHPRLFSTLQEPLEKDQADFIFADMFIVNDEMRILREIRLPDYSFKECFCNWYFCGVATLYRRSLHEKLGYYDETAMADDHECYLRFAMNGARFLHIPKTLYSVRSHHDRQVGLHSQARFNALLQHSKELTLKARAWLAEQKGGALA